MIRATASEASPPEAEPTDGRPDGLERAPPPGDGSARAERTRAPPAEASDALRLEVEERVPLAFLLVNPSGAAARVRSSVVIDLVSDVFEAYTDFAVRAIDPASVADCKGRLPCLVRAVRTDYDPAELTGPDGILPFRAHQLRVEARGLVVPKALLVLSSIGFGDKDRLIPQWIDTDEALSIAHEADRVDPEWEREVEARVREYAVPVRLPSRTVVSEAEARAFFERMVTEHLRPELERGDHWAPFGTLVLEAAPEGAAIRLDGRTVGTSRAGRVVLTGVRPGPRRVELQRPGFAPWGSEAKVEQGRTVVLRPNLRPPSRTHPGRTAFLWAGIGLSAAGLAVTAWALASAPNETTYCPAPCSDRFLALGEPTDTDTARFDPAGGEVLLAPLGYGLALTGVSWSVGSAFFGDDQEVPWWSVLGGLALGGAAYGVSAALDPGAP